MKRKLKWSAFLVSVVGVTLLAVGNLGASTYYSANVLPPAKARMLDAEAQARANAWITPKTTHGMALASVPIPARVGGIVLMHQGPFFAGEFQVNDVWDGAIASKWLIVYAGGSTVDGASVAVGGIRIYTEPVDPNSTGDLSFVGEWKSSLAGALTIVSVEGNIITFRNDNGSKTTFNLITHSFG